MKRWKKILLLLAAILLVAIACIISWSYGFRQGIRAGGVTSSMAELMLANQHMADQMANANCEGVKEAINDYLKVVEKYKDVKEGLITETTYYGDLMLGHIRLARMEEYLGNGAEAQKHMAIAKEACARRRWKECSEDKLFSFAKRLEETNPIGCLSSKK
jgi:F0F1-type ATP synthase membrane subunit c/vacuolar-type H+-ATPase subunit K